MACLARHRGGRLAGYSGGTAQAFDLLPFYPSPRGHPDVKLSLTGGGLGVKGVRALRSTTCLAGPILRVARGWLRL